MENLQGGVKPSQSGALSINSAAGKMQGITDLVRPSTSTFAERLERGHNHAKASLDGLQDCDDQLLVSGGAIGPLCVYRPRRLKVLGIFPKDDNLLTGIRTAVNAKLDWEFERIKGRGELVAWTGSQQGAQENQGVGGASGVKEGEEPRDPGGACEEQGGENPLEGGRGGGGTVIDILIVDFRQPKNNTLEILPIVKYLKSEKIVMAAMAIVKKNYFDKNEKGAEELLSYGIDRVELDYGHTSSGSYWLNSLVQMEESVVNVVYKLNAVSALVAALDSCRDMVQITDARHRVQFVNRAYEKVLGFSRREICGWNFVDVQSQSRRRSTDPGGASGGGVTWASDTLINPPVSASSTCSTIKEQQLQPSGSTSLTAALGGGSSGTASQIQVTNPGVSPPFFEHVMEELSAGAGKEWEGSYMFNRKSGDPVFLNSRVLSVNSGARQSNPMALLGAEVENGVNKAKGEEQRLVGGAAVACAPQSPPPGATHYVYVSDVPGGVYGGGDKSFSSDVTSNQDLGYPMPRGSLKSLRKASYDIKSISNDSSILRRQSLAKLHSLTIEAPITKVINIIAAAQQNCPLYIATALERVLEILRTTELYSPQFFEGNKVRSDDPLTTDLLGALLSQGPKPSMATPGRRASNENSRLAPRPSLPDIAEAPNNVQKLLETEARWDFDIILLEEITEKRPLVWLGMTIFARFGVAQSLSTDETTLRNWLTLIEANYHSSNTYHNSTHAADVLQATAFFISTDRLKTFLEPVDEAISLIAAVVHDVDHPGKTSAFLTNSGNDLALLYNDLTVLESHHAAFTFKLTLSDPRVNIFKNLDTETYKTVRRSVIDMVLATEMPKHFEHLAKFVNVFTKPFVKDVEAAAAAAAAAGAPAGSSASGSGATSSSGGGGGGGAESSPLVTTPTEPDISTLITGDNVILIKRMLIKCADVANPARPLRLCIEWGKRIAEEYFRQTEEEIKRGLPPVMPMFERSSCSIPKSQTGFVDYFIADMYEAWDAFLDVPEVIEHMKYNYEYWKDVEKKGVRSAQDLDAYLAKIDQKNMIMAFSPAPGLQQSSI